jgi:hypothetical protein
MASEFAHTTAHVKIVRQSDAMPRGHLKDLVLAVTVEGCPLDTPGLARPIEYRLMALMADNQLTAFMITREAYYE